MKIIHCADLHLGSALSSIPSQLCASRMAEIRSAFKNMIEYAKDNDIHHIILAGDIFDKDLPIKKDKDYFYEIIENHPDITFLYLKGNHDSNTFNDKQCDNLWLFNENWTTYSFDKIKIWGIELNKNNHDVLYDNLKLNKDDINIVVMHGDINGHDDNSIDLKKLKDKNIDYLALGHLHTYAQYPIDNRGLAVYAGCLEGRGFDELGPKGFVVLDINGNKITHQFHATSIREILNPNIDLTNATGLLNAQDMIKEATSKINKDAILKITLTGEVNFDYSNIENDIEQMLRKDFFYLKVEQKLSQKIDFTKYENDLSFRGEFVNTVLKNIDYSQEDKEEIIRIGLKILNGERIKQ